jgi:hypothetical protein
VIVIKENQAVPVATDVDAAISGDVPRRDLEVGYRRIALGQQRVLQRF